MPGHNNWFKTNLKLETNLRELPFEIELEIPATVNTNFEQASDATANLIANKFDNLHLCLSGGMDSEYVATVFIRNKIPFTPVILKTKTNLGEAWYAEHFCHRYNLTPVILDYINDNNQLLRTMFEYSQRASINPTISFFPHVIANHIELQGGSLITGYGDPYGFSNNYSVVIDDQLDIEEHDFYLDLSFGDRHPGAFISYTPDMFFSFIQNLPMGINIQVAKEILYQIPVRSKIVGDPVFPEFVPTSALEPKDPKLRCIKTTKSYLLDHIGSKSTIKLSCA